MKKTFPLIIAFTLLTWTGLGAQKISGSVTDDQNKPLEKSTVSLLRGKDSGLVKITITGADGNFSFNAADGNYLVSITHVGYITTYSKKITVSGSNISLPAIQLNKIASNLQGVTVSSQKPMVEVRAEKTILNVEGTINSTGSDALELLRKSPGVTVDKDENISLAGKNGVQVYVDGKSVPLSGTDLSSYLKSLQSAQIESIEIITNPSAKYDAAGNAGIINIRLKKNKALGTNGSVNLGYVQGVYAKYNGGLNINHRDKKVNLFANYNYNNGVNLMNFTADKTTFDTFFHQLQSIRFKNNTSGFKAGADYFISNYKTFGAQVTGNIANNDVTTAGPMYFNYIPTNQLVKVLKASNNNSMTRDNVDANLNYKNSVPNKQDFSIDADYAYYKIRSDQYQPNYYYMSDGTTEISHIIYSMLSPTNIYIYSAKTDYENNYKGGRLGFGAKFNLTNTDNDFKRYNVLNAGKVLDTLKSNLFKYNENINAAYINYNKQTKKGFLYQVGLRAEETNSKGHSTGMQWDGSKYIGYDSVSSRHYLDIFPSASLTLNKNPMKMWTFTFSRRIDRPAYQDLNPFEFKLNEYTFMRGNTQLRPQYTNSVGITNIYKYKLTTQLNYSHVKDIFAQLPDTINKTQSFLTKKNLATQDIVSFTISYPFQYKNYSFFANLNSSYSHYVANFGGGNRNIDLSVFSLTYFMQNSLKIGKKGWTAELSGFLVTPSVWAGTIKSKFLGNVDVGLQKTMLKGKGTLKASLSDALKTMTWRGTSNFAGVQSEFKGHAEHQQFKLSFSYRFGNSQVKAARQRKSGIEDEDKRTQQSGGQGGMQQR